MAVLFRPFGDFTQAPAPRTQSDRAFFRELSELTGLRITHSMTSTVDYEEWMEPATLLAAFLRRGLETLILNRTDLDAAIEEPLARIAGSDCPNILIGRIRRDDGRYFASQAIHWPLSTDNLALLYGELGVFHTHAGRRVALAHVPGEPMPRCGHKFLGTADEGVPVGNALAQFAGTEVLVKQVWPAKCMPLVRLNIDRGATPESAESLLIQRIGLHFCRFEGDQNSLLVQERISMRFETRFFVIGHRVVTGAGAIESSTPRQHLGRGRLNPVFEKHRNSGHLTGPTDKESNDAAEILLNAADDWAQEIKAECPELDTYVLDLALDEEMRPVIVELNPASTSGLYAVDADLLAMEIYFRSAHAAGQEVEPLSRDYHEHLQHVDAATRAWAV